MHREPEGESVRSFLEGGGGGGGDTSMDKISIIVYLYIRNKVTMIFRYLSSQ